MIMKKKNLKKKTTIGGFLAPIALLLSSLLHPPLISDGDDRRFSCSYHPSLSVW